jgi:hypothetical protein
MRLDPSYLILLEVLGALLYLLNKIFLDFMERCELNHYASAYWFWRKWAWDVYLLGSLFVIVFLVNLPKRALILASIEAGGIPSMLYGSVAARRKGKAPAWLDWLMVGGVFWGTGWSISYFRGLNSGTQLLELIGSLGFIVGLYLLAKNRFEGYFGFMVMNLATGLLFIAEHRWMFAVQQLVSIVFVLEAYWIAKGHEPFIPIPPIFGRRIYTPRIA